MLRIYLTVGLLFALGLSIATANNADTPKTLAPAGATAPEIAYLMTGRIAAKGLVDVYNLSQRGVYAENDGYLSRRDGRHTTEFAGRFKICSTVEMLCIRGRVLAVIPRVMRGETEWRLEDISCRSAHPIWRNEVLDVRCDTKDFFASFIYSPILGIIWYKVLDDDPMVLSKGDAYGLLASEQTGLWDAF